MKKVDRTLKKADNVNNVKNKYINNVNNEIENKVNELMALLDKKRNKPKVVARQIIDKLGDKEESLNFHIKMAKIYKTEILFECVSLALDANSRKKVGSLPKYYVGILRKKGLLPIKNRG